LGLTSPEGKISSTSGPPRRAAHQTHSWPHRRRTGMLERGHAPNASLCAAVPVRVRRLEGGGGHQLGRSRCQGPGSPPASMPLRTLALFRISASRRTRRAALTGSTRRQSAHTCRALSVAHLPVASRCNFAQGVPSMTRPEAKPRRFNFAWEKLRFGCNLS
jgi:hypothetical protein